MPKAMSPRMANLLLLLAGATWGFGFVAQVTAMEDIGPMAFIGMRFLLAGMVTLPFAVREFNRLGQDIPVRHWLRMLPVGVVFFLGMALQQVGLLSTTATNAGFLTALYVVIVPLILLLVLRQPPQLVIWPASAMALVGIYFLSGGDLSALRWGDWLIILCAFFWAIHVVLVGSVVVSIKAPVIMATLQFFVCGLLGIAGHIILPFFVSFEPPINIQLIHDAFPEIAYTGILAGGFAFTLQAIGQQYTSQAAAAILLSTESLFAALFGALLLGEMLSGIGYLGCALIFAALLLVELKPSLPKRIRFNRT